MNKKLAQVWELIDTEEKWCKQFLALNDKNMPCSFMAEDAKRFCVLGALSRIYSSNGFSLNYPKELDRSCLILGFPSLAYLNDHGGYQQVKRLFIVD